jgi:hypothetical protein
VGIAAATKPGATVDSVIGAVMDNLNERANVPGREDGWYADYAGVNIVDELETGLRLTQHCRDFRELREAFDPVYNGVGMPYCMSYANEVVTKAVCAFKMTNGNLKDTIVAAVNLGRDTDCVAAVAAGWPARWTVPALCHRNGSNRSTPPQKSIAIQTASAHSGKRGWVVQRLQDATGKTARFYHMHGYRMTFRHLISWFGSSFNQRTDAAHRKWMEIHENCCWK